MSLFLRFPVVGYFGIAGLRLLSLATFVALHNLPNTLDPHETVYGLRIQHHYATQTTIPSLYPDAIVESWLRSVGPLSVFAAAVQMLLMGSKLHYIRVTANELQSLVLQLLGLTSADVLLQCFSAWLFQQPTDIHTQLLIVQTPDILQTTTWRFIALFVLVLGELSLAVGNISLFPQPEVEDRATVRIKETDVQLMLSFAMQSGIHVVRCAAIILHMLQLLNSCADANSQASCEFAFVLMTSVTCVVFLLVAPALAKHQWVERYNVQTDRLYIQNYLSSLFVQFAGYPFVITLFSVDRRALAPTRLVAFCAIVSSAMLALSMAVSLSTFFKTEQTRADVKDTTANPMSQETGRGQFPKGGFIVYRASKTLQRQGTNHSKQI